ncbi:hypothetical protein VSS37_03865 [Candidatus Thiothrix sp. Deng01]|uniref:Uncharacterized protein n=1 Tax=Candidatus Thiothrix phosphatis TaxID=3112415 RepID=A0ABU6CUQ7_9GAMM|nr:hypothetical protein [Candidatus Thiothrix sp. Deng01]MEB4590108.1 hypothetical protein [Candidatus Thiothrix sp. Deng01]
MSVDISLGYTVSRRGKETLVSVEIGGVTETRTVGGWAKEWKLSPSCVSNRLKRQVPLEQLCAASLRLKQEAARKAGVFSPRNKKPVSTPEQAAKAARVRDGWLYRPAPGAGA